MQLQTALWGPDLTMNANYLTWKYEQNPYLDESLIYLALHKERVVGMRGLCGAQWEIGHTGQSVIMPCAGDTTTDLEHRGRGLMRQILQFTQTDTALAVFPYMLGLSARRTRLLLRLERRLATLRPLRDYAATHSFQQDGKTWKAEKFGPASATLLIG